MISRAPLSVSPLAARKFSRRVLGLDSPCAHTGQALARYGYVQIDPVNICGRMHDLILRNRVVGYREGDLMRHLHGEGSSPLAADARRAFEHHVPGTGILVAFPLDAWPYLAGAMRRWATTRGAWAGKLTPRESVLANELLNQIRLRGPLSSEDFDDDRRAPRVWGAARLVKATLQKLFFHGRVLIAQRTNHRRRYDLPERVLPSSLLKSRTPDAEETARWLVLLKLRQRRLVTLKKDELNLVGDAVHQVAVAGCPPLYCLHEDVPQLLEIKAFTDVEEHARVSLLAPLDPLIYDRRLTTALWNFDYTWEAYTPPAKRVRGHYALPVLVGTELVGHVSPKAERRQGKLIVVSRSIRRGHKIVPALHDLARWLGLRRK